MLRGRGAPRRRLVKTGIMDFPSTARVQVRGLAPHPLSLLRTLRVYS